MAPLRLPTAAAAEGGVGARSTVIICEEPDTSKTCGMCGDIHEKLGGNKNFKCPNPSCSYVADRDANGVRYIFARYMTVNGVEAGAAVCVAIISPYLTQHIPYMSCRP